MGETHNHLFTVVGGYDAAIATSSSLLLEVGAIVAVRVVMSCALSSDARDRSVPKELARGYEDENSDGHGDDDAILSFSSTSWWPSQSNVLLCCCW